MPAEMPEDGRFLTLRQVAEILNVSPRYVRTLRQSGALAQRCGERRHGCSRQHSCQIPGKPSNS
jgi:hypothetical protein